MTRAKKAVLLVYSDSDRAHWATRLVEAVLEALSAPSHLERIELKFLGGVDPDLVTRDHPTIAHVRSRVAARIAIAELASDRALLPSTGPPAEVEQRRDALLQEVKIGVSHSGGGYGLHDLDLDLVEIDQAYQRSRRLGDRVWMADPDVFTEALGDLPLNDRSKRTLDEAIHAYRPGLFLAAASLVGVVVEAAWYAAQRR